MSNTNKGYALIVSSFLLASSVAPSILAQTAAGPVALSNGAGILPPNPTPTPIAKFQPQPTLDYALFTTYSIYGSPVNLNWSVCGSTKMSTGCYGGGTFGPFGKIGAMIEGQSSSNATAGTVTRNIYIVDEAVGGGTAVTLYIYKRTDVITSTSDTITSTLVNTIPLSLVGGTQANTYLAANDRFLYIGTNQNGNFVQINKSNLAVNPFFLTGLYPDVSSITNDQYGYVTVNGSNSTGSTGYETFSPAGNPVQMGGGNAFMLNATSGISTGPINVTSVDTALNFPARMQVHLKKATP